MADRYRIGAGGNWNDTANWSTSSGGSGGASVPNNTTDKAIFDGSSGNAVINTTGLAVYDLDIQSTYPNGNQISLGSYNFSVTRHLTINANAISPITSGGSAAVLFAGGSSASTWAFNGGTLDVNFRVAGSGQKTMTGNVTINGYVYWSAVSNLVGAGYYMYVKNGWTGASYFNDLSNNPFIVIQGGNLDQTLPNSQTGCILEPSVANITFTNHATDYKTDIRENTYLIIKPSTYATDHSGAVTRFISYTGKMDIQDTAFKWNNLQWASSTFTALSDIKVSGDIQGVSSTVTFNGLGKRILLEGNFRLYGANTITGTGKLKLINTSQKDFNTTAILSGATLAGTTTLGIDIEFAGSALHVFADRPITFTGGKRMKVNSGATVDIDGTSCNFIMSTDGFIFDIGATSGGYNELAQLTVSGGNAYIANDMDVGGTGVIVYAGYTLGIHSGKTLQTVGGSDLRVDGTSIIGYGNIIKQDISGAFAGTRHGFISGGYSGASGSITLTAGKIDITPNTNGLDILNINSENTWTVVAKGVCNVTSTNGYLFRDANAQFGFIRITANGYVEVGLTAGVVGYYKVYSGAANTFSTSTKRQIVVTKLASESSPKVYVDGVLLTGGTSGSGGGGP